MLIALGYATFAVAMIACLWYILNSLDEGS
jgi:hypothetical protein